MKRLTILTAIIAILLTSCTKKVREKMLPNISGKAGEVVFVIENDLWKSAGDTIQAFVCEDVPGLPQDEPMFNLIHIPSSAFTEIFERHRNIVSCKIEADSAPSIRVATDLWARPQTIIQITAPSGKEFISLFAENADKITGILLKAEQDRIVRNYSTFPDRTVMQKLERAAAVQMTIPKGYTFDMDTNNFIWISHETPEISQGIFVYYYDYTDTATFTRNFLINKRNEMLKLYVAGPSEGSYMTTDDHEGVTTFRSYNWNGNYTAELRGLWRTEGDFMGGPFVSLTQFDKARNRIVTIDSYVYAGKKDKRNYMRQLEAIMSTMKFAE